MIKCPHCGKSHYSVLNRTTTCLGWVPIYKDDVLVNEDPNKTTTTYLCQECHKTFTCTVSDYYKGLLEGRYVELSGINTISKLPDDYNNTINKINSYDNYKLPDDYDISHINDRNSSDYCELPEEYKVDYSWKESKTFDTEKFNKETNKKYMNIHNDYLQNEYNIEINLKNPKASIDMGGFIVNVNHTFTEEQIKNIKEYFGWEVINYENVKNNVK